jgi:predicted acylesterase/phospholipase RssA
MKNYKEQQDLKTLLAILSAKKQSLPPSAPKTALALQGGGAKGAAYEGYVEALEKKGMLNNLEVVAGSSAGAISTFMIALGFSGAQFKQMAQQNNFLDLMDARDSILGYTVAGSYAKLAADFLWYGSAYSGKNMHNWARTICEQILGDPDATFADLQRLRETNPALKELIVTGTQILPNGSKKAVVFSEYDSPNVVIADAIRASMSFPGAFEPFIVREKQRVGDEITFNEIGTFVDGGVMNNWPIDLLDNERYSHPDYPLQNKMNQCSFGATLCSASSLDASITPIPESAKNKSKQKNEEPKNHLVQPSSLTVFNVLHSAWIKNIGAYAIPEDIKEKMQKYRNSLAQIYNEGVDALDFGTPLKGKLAENATVAFNNFWSKHCDPTKLAIAKRAEISFINSLNENSRKVWLEKMFFEFMQEIELYYQEPRLENFNLEHIEENLKLQYLANHIQELLNKEKSPENTLSNLLERHNQNHQANIQLRKSHHDKINVFLDDNLLLAKLKSLLDENNHEAFSRLFASQLSRCIELSQKTIPGTEDNLIIYAARNRHHAALNSMLAYIRTTCHQLDQHGRKLDRPFKVMINQGFNPSLLEIALDNNDLETLDVLLKHHLNPIQLNNDNLSYLHKAIDNENIPALRKMLAKTDIKSSFTKSFGADKNTLLHYIVDKNKLDICEQLFFFTETKATIKNINWQQPNAKGITILESFAEKDEFWELLTRFKDDFGLEDKSLSREALKESAKLKEDNYSSRKQGIEAYYNKLLHSTDTQSGIVSDYENTQNLKALLGLEEHIPGTDLLHRAVIEGNTQLINTIIEKLKDEPNLIKKALDKKYLDKTPLYLAAETGNYKLIELFRYYDAKVEETGPKPCPSAITIAAKNKHGDAFDSLINSKPYAFNALAETITRTTRDEEGRTALHYLAMHGLSEQFNNAIFVNPGLIKSYKDYTNILDNNGNSVLRTLCNYNQIDLLRNFIQKNVSTSMITEKLNYRLDNFFDLTTKRKDDLTDLEYIMLNPDFAATFNQGLAEPLTELERRKLFEEVIEKNNQRQDNSKQVYTPSAKNNRPDENTTPTNISEPSDPRP